MTSGSAVPQLTILVPTRNEAENVEPLLKRLSASVEPASVVLFVDDSDDETPQVIQAARARGFGSLDIRLLHRSVGQRNGGLGGAVLAGLEQTSTQWVCVMDGDLQHPPEVVPRLLDAARIDHADLMVASRYVRGGRNEGLGAVRTAVSWASTVLAKAIFPHRLRGIRDPMSGFFLFRREALTEPMTPRGFKVLLEIAVRHPDLVRGEVPFVFVERSMGVSKGTLREGFRYLRLLAEMRWSLRRQPVRAAQQGEPETEMAA
ncbi:MAG TPA: glycosyltransferase [Propionibacteriaceae bacterium]|nr:glycosyltransferase [Propionibacteriaceae bacterium]